MASVFVEKNADSAVQAKFDALNGRYMDLKSAVALGLPALFLPVMGSFPSATMQRMAEFGQEFMHGLVELAEESGFYGSLWHCYLTNLLVNHENSYSRSREIRGAVSSSINVAALHDFEIFRRLFDYDFRPLALRLGVREFDSVLSFAAGSEKSRIYNRRIRDRICTLAGQLAETSTA